MAEQNSNQFALLLFGIIALVAIVALVVVVDKPSETTVRHVMAEEMPSGASSSGENIVGDARADITTNGVTGSDRGRAN